MPPRRRRLRRAAVIVLAGGAVALPAAALALPSISGGDGAVINPANQSPDFTISSSDPFLSWEVTDGSGFPVQNGVSNDVELQPLPEGTYTLTASDIEGQSSRVFTVDTTPPGAPVVSSPAQGAEYTVGQAVTAAYDCPPGATCTPAPGSAVDTSSPGAKVFTVTARDAAGNATATDVHYTVSAPPPVDQTPPVISISTPAEGATYPLGATRIAAYECTDAASGVAGCEGTVPKGAAIDTGTVGSKTFTVTATDNAGNAGVKVVSYTVADTVDPTVSIASPGAAKYQINTIQLASYSCDDNAPGVVCAGTVPSGDPIDTASLGQKTFVVQATDASGNTTAKQLVYEVVDTHDPSPAGLVGPPDDTVTNELRPKLNWTAATDPGPGGAPGSGVARYEVVLDGKQVASVDAGTTSWAPGENLKTGQHQWRVRAVDRAGNVALSDIFNFKVDPNATPAPAITAAPPAATNDNTPSFEWTGEPGAQEFEWALRQGTATVAKGSLGGGVNAVTPGPLPDGDYVFTLTQRTNGNHGAAAAHPFTVDTVAPGPLTIVVRPAAVSGDVNPLFAWAGGEANARYLWQLSGPGGVVVQGPAETPINAALLTVSAGSYVFQVRQVDAAGNPSPLTIPEPFTVTGGTPPPPPPPDATPQEPDAPAPAVPRKATKTVKQARTAPTVRNAKSMTPRAGARIVSVRPVLRWKKRRGASLYNVQIFRLKGAKLTKVVTAFPRGATYRVPRGKLKAGHRYVWRVWPYVNRRFPSQPLGISYFDVRQTPRSLARSRMLAPRQATAKAGRALTVRWRAKSGASAYKLQVLRGATVAFERVLAERSVVVPASALAKGKVRVRILRAVHGSDTAFAKAPWAQADLKLR